MTEYKVNVDGMRASAEKIESAGRHLKNVGAKASDVSVNQGAYEGQLAAKVKEITSGASGTANQLGNRASELANALRAKADAFQAVFEENWSGVQNTVGWMSQLISSSPFVRFFAKLGLFPFKYADLVWVLAGFGPSFSRWITVIPPQATHSPAYEVPFASVLSTGQHVPAQSFGDLAVSERLTASVLSTGQHGLGIGVTTLEKVPLTDGRLIGKEPYALYFRGDGKTSSNCTWYVAAAIKTASNGKLDLNAGKGKSDGQFTESMGNAHEWADRARKAMKDNRDQYHPYIKDVNKQPAAGSVLAYDIQNGMPAGHVAYIETADLVKDSKLNKTVWQITVSEENYGGGNGFSGATRIVISGSPEGSPEVVRYRRTLVFEVDETTNPPSIKTDKKVDIIHFKY